MLNPRILLAEPLIFPSTSLSIMAGLWYWSTKREATMPMTPKCQSGLNSTSAEIRSIFSCSSICSTASFIVVVSVSRRFALIPSNSLAIKLASGSSLAINNFTAVDASPIRPAALIRGPMENTIFLVSNSACGTRIRFIRA